MSFDEIAGAVCTCVKCASDDSDDADEKKRTMLSKKMKRRRAMTTRMLEGIQILRKSTLLQILICLSKCKLYQSKWIHLMYLK